MKIKCIIIDDEPFAIKIIENYLPENNFNDIINYIEYSNLLWFFCRKPNKNSKETDFIPATSPAL